MRFIAAALSVDGHLNPILKLAQLPGARPRGRLIGRPITP
jgi:hypothetical protein